MMYLIVLLVALTCLALSIRLLGVRQLCSPAVLFLGGMTIAVLLAIVGRSSWNNIELGIDVALILIVGTVSYTVACVLSHKHSHGAQIIKGQKAHNKTLQSNSYIIKYLFILAFVSIAIILRVRETIEIADILGLSKSENYFAIAEAVRGSTTALVESGGGSQTISFSFWVNQADKVIAAAGFASAVIFAARLSDGSNRKMVAFPGAVLLLSAIYYLMANTRTGILWFVAAFFVAYYIINSTKDSRCLSAVKVLVLFGVVLAGVAFFYVFGMMFGRGTGSGITEYISFYYGSEIPSLQALLSSLPLDQSVPGGYTFNSLYSIICKLFPIGGIPDYSIAWIDFGGLQSNVFSCFARYYLDFRYVGVILFPFILGWCLTGLYERTLRAPSSLSMLIYCCFSPFIFDMVREEYFYSRFISTTQIITLLLTVVVFAFLTWDLRDVGKKLLGKVQKGKQSDEEP